MNVLPRIYQDFSKIAISHFLLLKCKIGGLRVISQIRSYTLLKDWITLRVDLHPLITMNQWDIGELVSFTRIHLDMEFIFLHGLLTCVTCLLSWMICEIVL